MIEASIARRYAKALVEIAHRAGQLEPFRLQVEGFEAILKTSDDLRDILSNRFVDVAHRLAVVEELASKSGYAQEVTNFLKLLVKKGRMDLYPFIAKAFQDFSFGLEGKVEATIASASPLSDDVYLELQKILSQKTGKEVLIRTEIKPEVLGGLRILLGNDIYDGTVQHSLDQMTQKMRESSFVS